MPVGTWPELCGTGFEADPRGGCRAILPAEPCPRGLMAIPGETSCREVADCGAEPWAGIPAEPDTHYVDAAYSGASSDGTVARPWTSIQAAIAAAPPGGSIAIAAGSYVEDLSIRLKPVRLWGRCPGMVEVVSTGGALSAIMIEEGADRSEVHRRASGGRARRGDGTGYGGSA